MHGEREGGGLMEGERKEIIKTNHKRNANFDLLFSNHFEITRRVASETEKAPNQMLNEITIGQILC